MEGIRKTPQRNHKSLKIPSAEDTDKEKQKWLLESYLFFCWLEVQLNSDSSGIEIEVNN